tara:strand:- start:16 stop:906 length:891 start_codon:yes stop_codon:yes gene_type:complete
MQTFLGGHNGDIYLSGPTSLLMYPRQVNKKSFYTLSSKSQDRLGRLQMEEPEEDIFIADSEANRLVLVTFSKSSGEKIIKEYKMFNRKSLLKPEGMCLLKVPDAETLVVFSDSGHNRIKILEPQTGRIKTLCGTGLKGYKNGVGFRSMFNKPTSLCVVGKDESRSIMVADVGNHCIRQIKFNNNSNGSNTKPLTAKYIFSGRCTVEVTTVLGRGTKRGFLDGTGRQQTMLNSPSKLSMINSSTFLISDSGNSCLRLAFRNPGYEEYTLTTILSDDIDKACINGTGTKEEELLRHTI